MHFSLSLSIYFNNLSCTCFERINYSSSGGSLLYMQHMVFVVHLRGTLIVLAASNVDA